MTIIQLSPQSVNNDRDHNLIFTKSPKAYEVFKSFLNKDGPPFPHDYINACVAAKAPFEDYYYHFVVLTYLDPAYQERFRNKIYEAYKLG